MWTVCQRSSGMREYWAINRPVPSDRVWFLSYIPGPEIAVSCSPTPTNFQQWQASPNKLFFSMMTSREDFKLIVLAVPGVVQVCFTALQSTDNIFVEKFVDITLLLFRSHLESWTDWIVRRMKIRTRNKKKRLYLKHFIVICELFIKKQTSFSINFDVYLHSIIY